MNKSPFKIMIVSLLFSVLGTMTVCELLIEYQVPYAIIYALGTVILMARYGRTIVEKAYGYTLMEALNEKLNKEDK